MNRNVKKDWLSLNPYLDIDTVTDDIIVHPSAEVEYLSKRYKVSAVKFSFIPYFWYEPAGKDEHREFLPMPLSSIFCSAGNNRDFDAFIRTINLTRDRGRIIGAKKGEIPTESQIEVYPSVLRDNYLKQIKRVLITL